MIGYSDNDNGVEEVVIPRVRTETYRELYALSDWMLKARPWEAMADFHCFVIEDPDSGDEQVAVVMGNAGQVYALHLYQPEEGTRWLARAHLSGGQDELLHTDGQYDQRLLEVEFTNENVLDEHDVWLDDEFAPDEWSENLEDGDLNCVTLRSVLPGCAPWHPTESEAARMLDGLRLLKRYYENHFEEYEWASFTLDDDLSVEIPRFRLPKGADRKDVEAWTFGMERYQAPPPKALPEILRDDVFVARLADLPLKRTCWEIGAVFIPRPAVHEGRPVYTVAALVVDSGNEFVESVEVGLASDCRANLIRRTLTKAASKRGCLPEEIAVASRVAELALKELSVEKGVKVSPVQQLPSFDEAAMSLLKAPGFGGMDAGDEIDEKAMDMLGDASPAEIEELEGILRDMMEASNDPFALAGMLKELEGKGENGKELAGMIGRMLDATGNETEDFEYRAPKSRKRFVFRVDLKGMKPPLWRRITLPTDATFFDLHLAIQAAFGWEGHHLHSFQVVKGGRPVLEIGWTIDGGYAFADNALETEATLRDVFGSGIKTVNYCYDFGDDWDHTIKLEKEVDDNTNRDVRPFEVIKGRGANPVEDCGGVWGLNAIIEGDHPFCDTMEPTRLREIQERIFNMDNVGGRDPMDEMALMDDMWRS